MTVQTTIQIDAIDSVEWAEVIRRLQLPASVAAIYFAPEGYAAIEITIDSNLRITGGRILPVDRD